MHDRFPLPDPDWPPTRPFWEAAARHELRIPRCEACGAWSWYPRARCRSCDAEAIAWEAVSGRGHLFSFTVVRHAFLPGFVELVPYATGLVALEEDPSVRLATRIVDAEPDALRVDEPVEVVFRTLSFPDVDGEVVAPLFTPSSPRS